MKGSKRGVSTQIIAEVPKAVYIHCLNHSLNLSVRDILELIKMIKEALGYSYEVIKLIAKSPKRETMMKDLKLEYLDDCIGIHEFSKTRFTVKHKSLFSIIANYNYIDEVLEKSIETEKNPNLLVRMKGVRTSMEKFSYYYGISLAYLILRITDGLAVSLQSKGLTALEGQELGNITRDTLKSLKTDEEFDNFWSRVRNEATDKQIIDEPMLPKKPRKKPVRLIIIIIVKHNNYNYSKIL